MANLKKGEMRKTSSQNTANTGNASVKDTIQKAAKQIVNPYTPEQIAFGMRLISDYHFYFEKCLKIRNKQAEVVPFITNPSQDKLVEIVEAHNKKYPNPKTRPTLYIIILKARQIGFSTTTEGIFFHDLHFNQNMVAMVVSYDDDSATNINEMSARFYQYLPDGLKPLTRAYRGKGLLFENPKFDPSKPIVPAGFKGNTTGLQNKFLIETAGNVSAGSSYTIMRLHISELAKWPKPEETMASLMQAVPDKGAVVIVESTAKGMNHFYKLWRKAEAGENNFKTLFIPWFEHAEYRYDFVNAAEEKRFEENLDRFEAEDGVNYREMKKLYGLTNQQINWYRRTLRDKCGGDVNVMMQENPSNSDEAFISTGKPVFNNQKVLHRKKTLENFYKFNPPKVGNIEFKTNGAGDPIKGTEKFVEDVHGWLTIYEMPRDGCPYVIGGDIAEGGIDWSTGEVLDNTSGRQVAAWRAHTDTDLYAKQMYALGWFYNKALLAVEMNFDTHPVKELDRLRYPLQYRREVIDSISNQTQYKNGFKTTSASRPLIIGELVAIVRDEIETINDLQTLEEMLHFVRNADGRPEAESGEYDDTVIALAIAHRARDQQKTHVAGKGVLEFPKNISEDEKERIKNNIVFMDKYNELKKYVVK